MRMGLAWAAQYTVTGGGYADLSQTVAGGLSVTVGLSPRAARELYSFPPAAGANRTLWPTARRPPRTTVP